MNFETEMWLIECYLAQVDPGSRKELEYIHTAWSFAGANEEEDYR